MTKCINKNILATFIFRSLPDSLMVFIEIVLNVSIGLIFENFIFSKMFDLDACNIHVHGIFKIARWSTL